MPQRDTLPGIEVVPLLLQTGGNEMGDGKIHVVPAEQQMIAHSQSLQGQLAVGSSELKPTSSQSFRPPHQRPTMRHRRSGCCATHRRAPQAIDKRPPEVPRAAQTDQANRRRSPPGESTRGPPDQTTRAPSKPPAGPQAEPRDGHRARRPPGASGSAACNRRPTLWASSGGDCQGNTASVRPTRQ